MPEVVILYVVPLLAVDVPVAVVCQYQVTFEGEVPFLVIVTPEGAHWGELLVGFGGVDGQFKGVHWKIKPLSGWILFLVLHVSSL